MIRKFDKFKSSRVCRSLLGNLSFDNLSVGPLADLCKAFFTLGGLLLQVLVNAFSERFGSNVGKFNVALIKDFKIFF